MAGTRRARLLLIVTGSSLRAEELDRPLAYYLKKKIEDYQAEHDLDTPRLVVRVVADFRWMNDEPLQKFPTISVGGPGVNALAHRWLEEVPVALAVDDRYYIQVETDTDEPPHASIWGMDNATTQIAVGVFLDRFYPRFVEHCDTQSPLLGDVDSDSDDD